MGRIRSSIPNAFTLSNTFLACLAIIYIFEDKLYLASMLILIAAVIDFLDGFVARLLGVSSELGKQLDSLSDMVMFGVVPGFVMYHLLYNNEANFGSYTYLYALSAFLIPITAAIRLGRFNIKEPDKEASFIGLPTPSTAIFIAAIPIILLGEGSYMRSLFTNQYVLYTVVFTLSFLSISNIKMFSLKFKSFNWPANKIRYIMLILSLALIITFKYVAIPFIILLYVFLSLINNINKNEVQSRN